MYLFISHSSKDAEVASGICDALEKDGNNCFLAPRNIRAGHVYAEEILDGIERSDCMVVVLSESANKSPHVLREIERAVSRSLPIIIYKLEDVELTKSMEYFLMAHQWMNAKADKNYKELVECVKNLGQPQETEQTQTGHTQAPGGRGRKPGKAAVYTAAIAAAALICFGVYRLTVSGFAGAPPKTEDSGKAVVMGSNTADEDKSVTESSAPDGDKSVTESSAPDGDKSVTESSAPDEDKSITGSSAPDEDKSITGSGTSSKDKNITGSGTAGKDKNIAGSGTAGRDKNITGSSTADKDKNLSGSSTTGGDKSTAGSKPAAKAKNADANAGVKVGDTVQFGSYNGKTVEWRVLKVSDDGKEGVLVSKDILTMKAFDAPESGKYGWDGGNYYLTREFQENTDMEFKARILGSNDWSTSNIRTWLNSEKEVVKYGDQPPAASAMSEGKNGYNNEAGFLNGFTGEELEAIKEVQVKTNGNALSGGGKITTKDRVYLLSKDELTWFEDAGISKLAAPTDAAVKQDKTKWYQTYSLDYGLKDYIWWLRDPVKNSASKCYTVGNGYTEKLIYDNQNVGAEGFGIRPAVTVKLDSSCIVREE